MVADERQIREAVPGDEAAFRRLWAAYLDYYAMPLAEEVTAATWARILDPGAPMGLRLIEVAGAVEGFALYLHHPSSWVTGDDCYLEDLFVAPQRRGQGLGRALIEDLMALARRQGWHRIYWMTDADNTRARALYDSVATCDNHLRYRRTL